MVCRSLFQEFLRHARKLIDVAAPNAKARFTKGGLYDTESFSRPAAIGIRNLDWIQEGLKARLPGLAMVAEQQMNWGSRP